ncbi:MAG: trypsin-like serine protease [Ruminococcaceae bacterium]|nr:trypsin-like serine protease [Oscillospiraceae bacterium]
MVEKKGSARNMTKRIIAILMSVMLLLSAGCAKEIIVTFDLSGGEQTDSVPLEQTIEAGTAATAPSVRKEGYTFEKWSADFSAPEEDITVKAIWKLNTYKVVFDPDGGTLENGALEQTVDHGAAPAAPVLSREGYTQTGWDGDFSGIKADATFKAIWKINEYTVTFDGNGGEVKGEATQTVKYGGAATEPTAERVGYTFKGWDTATDNITKDVTSKAVWEINSYTVVFDPAGGNIYEGEATQTVNYGSAATVPLVMREGHTFDGWDKSFDSITEDITVTAKWKINVFEVIFDTASGTRTGGGQLTQTVEYGKSAVLPEVTREGYRFGGWDQDVERIVENMKVTALWKELKYEVTFNLNGGTLESGDIAQTVSHGGKATAPKTSREGYTFNGWDRKYDDVKDDIIVTAKWKIKKFTVTFDLAGGKLDEGQTSQTVEYGKSATAPKTSREGYNFNGWDTSFDSVKSDISVKASWVKATVTAQEVYEKVSPATVEIYNYGMGGLVQQSLGTGFIVESNGVIVSCHHVIDGAFKLEVKLSTGKVYEVTQILAYDADYDLAILKVEAEGLPTIQLSTREVKTGETVYAIGSSLGLTGSLSEGIVSQASREIEGVDYIQTTAPISSGNSGGPLVNEYGEAIGVNILTAEDGQNINLAAKVSNLDKLDRSNPITPEDFGKETGSAISMLDILNMVESEENGENAQKSLNNTMANAEVLDNGQTVMGTIYRLYNYADNDYYWFDPGKPAGEARYHVVVMGLMHAGRETAYVDLTCNGIAPTLIEKQSETYDVELLDGSTETFYINYFVYDVVNTDQTYINIRSTENANYIFPYYLACYIE